MAKAWAIRKTRQTETKISVFSRGVPRYVIHTYEQPLKNFENLHTLEFIHSFH